MEAKGNLWKTIFEKFRHLPYRKITYNILEP